jgi:anaerobic selenocysteine-containing dehydrogenase
VSPRSPAGLVRRTVCNRDCPDACAILATLEEGRVVRIQGDPSHPVTRGFLCHRTSRFLSTQYSPERVTTPLLREGSGFRAIGWDEALDTAARRLLEIRAESGPAAIFHYRSGGTLGMLPAVMSLFFERFGPVTVKRGDICSGAGDWAQMTDFGEEESHDLFDLESARHILLWGKNPYVSSPHLLPVLRRARERGARLTLVDPVRHRTAGLCDRHVQPRPGGDFALAMAVARILLDEEWADAAAASYCDGWEEFAALVRSREVSGWCEEADVPAEEALDIARLLGPGKPCAILVGWGMGRRVNGAAIVRALDALGAISGNLGIPGGGVSFYFKRKRAFDTSFARGEAAAPRTICEPLFGPEVLAAKDPPIRAVWVTAGNPVAMLPESGTVRRALETRDLVVVCDAFLTDTARCAHLVLPTPTLLEADDLLGAYGHHWIGAAVPVVPPPEGVRSDLEIAQGLAARTGLAEVVAGSAREWKERILRPEVKAAGVTVERLEREGPARNPLAPSGVLFADRRFPTPSGRVNLLREAPPPREPAPLGYALTLLSLSTERSQSSQWAAPQEGPAEATLHPDAAGGLEDGALARLESRIGAMTVRLRHDARQRKDVVIVPKGGHLEDGRCANALVRARTTDAGEGGALYDEPVRVVPLAGTLA